MEATTENGLDLAEASKRLAHRMLLISENRLELLLVEIQEERQRILRALWLTVGATAFTLLAAITLTAVIALVFWEHSPVIALSQMVDHADSHRGGVRRKRNPSPIPPNTTMSTVCDWLRRNFIITSQRSEKRRKEKT